MRNERLAFTLAGAATAGACLPSLISVILGDPADALTRWLLIAGLAAAAASFGIGLWLRHKRLTGRVMLRDLRAGSTVSRGISATGRTRNHMGVSPASAFVVMSALALAMGGLAFVYLNLWDY